MTLEEERELRFSQGYCELPEYPGVIMKPLLGEEQTGWDGLLDLAGKPRKGPHHQPMEWMVHGWLVRTSGAAVTAYGEKYLGNAHHFRRICDLLFNVEGSMLRVEWNPHTVKIIEEFFENRFLALLGSASSGKSFTMALIGVVMFMINPRFTKVLVTCTTKEAGMGKIWGDINNCWNQVEKTFREWGIPLCGKMMSEPVMIRYQHPEYTTQGGLKMAFTSHKSGLQLIATLQSSEKQTVNSVQGYKNDTVIFLGDEWDSFSPALAETVIGNLRANRDSRCIASFNISSRNSAGGLISTPVDGWDSISIDDDEWDGPHGKVLRFDAMRSCNVLLEEEAIANGQPKPKLWAGIADLEYVNGQRDQFGEESVKWWMFVRAWPPPIGDSRFIYSEQDLTKVCRAHDKVVTWLETPLRIAANDPDFTFNGDGSVLVILNIGKGQVNGGTNTICEVHRVIDLSKYITPEGGEHDKQIALLIKRFMNDPATSFDIKNLGVDITGASSFGTVLNEFLGTGWIPLDSRARPTELPVSKADTRKCVDVFENLLAEMWISPKALIRSGQIKGLDAETRREMCLRCYTEHNQRGRQEVESKKLMKKRNKKMSPNRADALFLGIQVARMKHKLISFTEAAGQKPKGPLSQMQQFYADNPHLAPKVPKWRRPPARQAFKPLKTVMNSW